MSKPINRVTLFKIPDVEHQNKLIEIYKGMPAKAVKNGQPYIRSVRAGPTKEDQRNQGYTIAVISVFDSVEDMVYYDNECAAHAELKTYAKSVHKGAMMVFFENVLDE